MKCEAKGWERISSDMVACQTCGYVVHWANPREHSTTARREQVSHTEAWQAGMKKEFGYPANTQDIKDRAAFLRGHMDTMKNLFHDHSDLLYSRSDIDKLRQMYLADCAEWSQLMEAERQLRDTTLPLPERMEIYLASQGVATPPLEEFDALVALQERLEACEKARRITAQELRNCYKWYHDADDERQIFKKQVQELTDAAESAREPLHDWIRDGQYYFRDDFLKVLERLEAALQTTSDATK